MQFFRLTVTLKSMMPTIITKAQPVYYYYDKIVIVMTIITKLVITITMPNLSQNCYSISLFVTVGFIKNKCYSSFVLFLTFVNANCYNIS